MRTRLPRWLPVALGAVVVVGGIVAVVLVLARHRDEVREAIDQAEPLWLAGALLLALAAVLGIGERWRAALRLLGSPQPAERWVPWFMSGQLGKYVPGGVWHVVGQGELAVRGGVSRRAAYSSVVLGTVGLYAAAGVVVALGSLVPRASSVPWWAVAVSAVLAVVLLEPHVLRRLLGGTGASPGAGASYASVLRFVAGSLPVWLLVGTSTAAVALAFDRDVSVVSVALAGVASWLVGFAFLPAPGGVGVREAVLTAALASSMGAGTASLVAITARLVFVVADLIWLPLSHGAAQALRRRTRGGHRPGPEPAPSSTAEGS